MTSPTDPDTFKVSYTRLSNLYRKLRRLSDVASAWLDFSILTLRLAEPGPHLRDLSEASHHIWHALSLTQSTLDSARKELPL